MFVLICLQSLCEAKVPPVMKLLDMRENGVNPLNLLLAIKRNDNLIEMLNYSTLKYSVLKVIQKGGIICNIRLEMVQSVRALCSLLQSLFNKVMCRTKYV